MNSGDSHDRKSKKGGHYKMIRFGTGGWRAVIGKDFIETNIRKVAMGVALLAKAENNTDKPVIVGYDRRFLSDTAAKWIAEVLAANGLRVLFMKRSAPTPLIMHTVKKQELHYGLEVTASHNPAIYNGIKLIVHEGRDASVEDTAKLEKIIDGIDDKGVTFIDFDRACREGSIELIRNPFNDFIDDIIARLDVNAIRERGLRLLFDPIHGSGTYPALVIFYTTRCTPDIINDNKDAYFGGAMPAPSEKDLSDLSLQVVRGDYDLGIALDGDGDRLGIIDSNGRYIGANEILAMLYYYLHEYKGWKGPVVRNLATTHMLDRIAESFGEKCYEVPVGFKYVSAKIEEVDAVLGGESSGGLTVRGHIFGKDSVYAASLFVEMVCAVGKAPGEFMAELREKYGEYVMIEDNLEFVPAAREAINKTLMVDKKLPSFGRVITKVNYEDGCKVYFDDDSFVICRFSGTEPLLRIFAEASSADTARGYIDAFRAFLCL